MRVGIGSNVEHLEPLAGNVIGLEYDFERTREAHRQSDKIVMRCR